jgi:hypothetical protein
VLRPRMAYTPPASRDLPSTPVADPEVMTTPEEPPDLPQPRRSGSNSVPSEPDTAISQPGALPAYLPNRYSTGERSTVGMTSGAPSFGAQQSYADFAFTRLVPPGMGGLDEVISGLRGVVLHLAAGLDTLERRSEV